jgi:ATP-dependent metalloprotease
MPFASIGSTISSATRSSPFPSFPLNARSFSAQTATAATADATDGPTDEIHRNNPELYNLRMLADKNATDAKLQAAYLRKLNELGYSLEVILRSSQESFAKNDQTKRELTLAMMKHDPGRLYNQLMDKWGAIPVVMKENMWSKLLGMLLSFGAIFFLIWWFSARSSGGGGLQELFSSHFAPAVVPDVKFNDVKGNEEAKEELADIADYLKNPEKFVRFGAKMPKGVLLTGEPGCGKTLLARALAGEAGVPFFFTSGSEFEEMLVGVGARRMRELFTRAAEVAPCIIFIDEIDAIGGRRDALDVNKTRLTLNQLLVQLDGFEKMEGVVVIAATNIPESLDPALVRPGRFDRRIGLGLPDVKARGEIINLYLRERGSTDIDVDLLARGTSGFSGADLENMVNIAAINATKKNHAAISMAELEIAKDTVIMGPEKKSMVISPENRKLIAYHEAGHAVVAYHSKIPIIKATVMPRGGALGYIAYHRKDDLFTTKQELSDQVAVAMGGRASEELWFGPNMVTQGAGSDFQKATEIVRGMVTQLGMSEKVGPVSWSEKALEKSSSQTKQLVESEVKGMLDSSYARTTAILKNNREQIERLAEALLKYETLSADEVLCAIEGRTIVRPDIIYAPPVPKVAKAPAQIPGLLRQPRPNAKPVLQQ